MLIILEGPLIPWRAHGGYGRKSFNPLYAERKQVQWQITEQNPGGVQKILGPIHIQYTYYFPIPKSWSKKKTQRAMDNEIYPGTRPDLTNLIKFYEDCLKDFVIEDDSFVCSVSARKFYAENPKVVIKISKIES